MRIRVLAATAVLSVVLADPARAVMAAKTPPSSLFGESQNVIIGKVTKITPETGILDASATALKGESPAQTLKIRIEAFPETLQSAKEGQPLVLFLGRRAASHALHFADRWYSPEPGGKGVFVVRRDREADLRQSYPGTTTALARLLQEFKDNNGKYTMLDKVSPDFFKGGTKQFDPASVKLPKPAGTIAVGQFGEDPKAPTVMVLKDNGLFRHAADASGNPTGEANADFTGLTGEPLSPYAGRFKGATAAALDANADGRTDLLINSKGGPLLLINRGFGCFFVNPDLAKTLGENFPLTAKWTAADVDGDKHDDLVIFTPDGKATAILNPPAK
jgi:hypothetical protein